MTLSNLKLLYDDILQKMEMRCIFFVNILNKGLSCIYVTNTKPPMKRFLI